MFWEKNRPGVGSDLNYMASFFNSTFLFAGGKLVYLYKKKLGSVPKCGDCKVKLHGVSHFSKLQSLQIFLCKINFYISYWLRTPDESVYRWKLFFLILNQK